MNTGNHRAVRPGTARSSGRGRRAAIAVSACLLLAAPLFAQASSCHFFINSDGTVQVGFPSTSRPNDVACDIAGITRSSIGVYSITVRNGYTNGEYTTTLCSAAVSNSGSGTSSVKLSPDPKPSPVGVEGNQTVWTVRTVGAALGLLQTAADRDFILTCSSR